MIRMVSVNGIYIQMEVDTGACTSVIGEIEMHKWFPDAKLKSYPIDLTVVTGDPVNILGYFNVIVSRNNVNGLHGSKFIVIKSSKSFTPLIGRTWLDVLYPGWRKIFLNDMALASLNEMNEHSSGNQVEGELVRNLVGKYPNVFAPEATGTIRHLKIDINLSDNAKPIFYEKNYSDCYRKT